MNFDQFVARRQETWKELDQILATVQKRGGRRLPLEQVERLGRLYRKAASDLAYARTYFPGSQAEAYLNQLVGRAHNIIYAEETQRLRSLWRFFAYTVPAGVRGAWRPVLLAGGLMLLGGLVGFLAILTDPNLAEALVPADFRYYKPEARDGEILPAEWRTLFAAAVFQNNVWVALLAFGLGVTLGVGTALVLFWNGLIVGALAAHWFQVGLSFSFWALILPHGVLELMAIFMAGGAGFCLGWPLVAPGDLSRRDAFVAGARRAAVLVVGAVPLLLIAAAIEGFITPAALPEWSKYAVAALTLVLGLAYWLLPGRRGSHSAGAGGLTDGPAP